MKGNVVIAGGSLKTEDVSKPDKVGDETKSLNIVEMSTELNKETTSSEKKTEGDTFKTGPGTPDEINAQATAEYVITTPRIALNKMGSLWKIKKKYWMVKT